MITVLAARNSLARKLKLMTFYLGTFLLCGRGEQYQFMGKHAIDINYSLPRQDIPQDIHMYQRIYIVGCIHMLVYEGYSILKRTPKTSKKFMS